VDPEVGAKQVARLQELKSSRDNAAVKKALAELKTAAEGTDNMMPPILKAVKALATLGEVCDTLRGVFGEYEMTVAGAREFQKLDADGDGVISREEYLKPGGMGSQPPPAREE
jgi:hypothetical protein